MLPLRADRNASRHFPPLLRGTSDALHLLHQTMQLCAEAGGLGFVFMHDGVFKQRIQPLDSLNCFVSLWHRHSQTSHIFQPIVYQTCGKSAAKPARLSIGQFHKNVTATSWINELHQKARPFILPGSYPQSAPCHILQYVTGTDRDPKKKTTITAAFSGQITAFSELVRAPSPDTRTCAKACFTRPPRGPSPQGSGVKLPPRSARRRFRSVRRDERRCRYDCPQNLRCHVAPCVCAHRRQSGVASP